MINTIKIYLNWKLLCLAVTIFWLVLWFWCRWRILCMVDVFLKTEGFSEQTILFKGKSQQDFSITCLTKVAIIFEMDVVQGMQALNRTRVVMNPIRVSMKNGFYGKISDNRFSPVYCKHWRNRSHDPLDNLSFPVKKTN